MMVIRSSWWKLTAISTTYGQCLSCGQVRYGSSQAAKKAKSTATTNPLPSDHFFRVPSKNHSCFSTKKVEAQVVESIKQNMESMDRVLILNEIYSPTFIEQFSSEGFKRIFCTYRSSAVAEVAKERLRSDPKKLIVENIWLAHCSVVQSEKEENAMKKLMIAKSGGVAVFSMCLGSSSVEWFHMVHRLVHTAGLYTFNTADWFWVIPAIFYWRQCFHKKLKSVNIVNAFFDIQHCLTITGSDVNPQFVDNRKILKFAKGFEDSGFDHNDVVLVRLTPRQAVMDALPSSMDRVMFKTFIKLIWLNKRIIPLIEETLPDCGMRLIEDGYRMVDMVYTLSPEKLLQLYLTVTQWPEFEGSAMADHLYRHHIDT